MSARAVTHRVLVCVRVNPEDIVQGGHTDAEAGRVIGKDCKQPRRVSAVEKARELAAALTVRTPVVLRVHVGVGARGRALVPVVAVLSTRLSLGMQPRCQR